MANDLRQIGAWVATGNPATVNESTPFLGGQLGDYTVTMDDIAVPSGAVALSSPNFPRVWQYVQVSAASAAPAAGQCVVWLDNINFVVTTVASITKRNQVAGALQSAAATVGNYTWILVSGVGLALTENGQTPAAGDALIGGATTVGRFGVTAQGTAPLCQQLGVFLGAKTVAFNGSSTLPADTCAVAFTIPRVGYL